MEMKATLYYRNQLDEHDRRIYDSLVKQWMHYEKNIEIDIPHCDLVKLTQAIHWDYPLLFYINYYNIEYLTIPFLSKMQIRGDYLYEKKQTEKMLNDCEQWARYVQAKRPKNVSTVQMALWLHDVVLYNVVYSEIKGIRAHNVIGVIEDKMAVCEGIAKTYKFLCDLMEIPCIYIAGTLDGEPHGWNLIWIGKEPAFVDVTNDTYTDGTVNRKHFLRSSNEMIHYEWERNALPVCRLTNKTHLYQ